MRRADRLFAIIQALRGGRVRRAEDIAAALEVSVRTVYRDLADLQAHGVPIDGERGVGYLLRDGYFLPPLALDAVEWDALRWGIAYVEAHGDLALAVAARTVGVKLAAAGRQGEASTLQDIAAKEGVSERYVGRMIRLAYLAPEVLEALVVKRRPPAISINEMVEVAKLPWEEQMGRVFG